MVILSNSMAKSLVILAGCFVLSACEPSNEWTVQPEGNGTAALGMSAPSFLADPRMVNQDQLVLDVSVNNISVPMMRDANGVWTGTINFDPLQEVNLTAAWSAQLDSTLLALAQAVRTFTVPDDPAGIAVRIAESRFTTDFHADDDGRSNIAELRAGTDPTLNTSPGTSPEFLPVRINFGVPESLRTASASVISALSLVVEVNERVFIVTRNGNVWSGETSEIAGNDVFIEASFFANSSRIEVLDSYKLRQALNDNGLFIGLDAERPNP